MSPVETWLLIGLIALVLAAAFIGAGRVFDWMLDRLFARPVHSVNRWEDTCPCTTDRTYHERQSER